MKHLLTFGFLLSTLAFQPSLKAEETSFTKTEATFASVEATGVIPIADRPVVATPCGTVNKNCEEAIDYLTNIIQNSQNLSSTQINELDRKIREALSNFSQAEEIRTNLRGEVLVPCQVDSCLIYTSWLEGKNKLFWINIQQKETSEEYPPSKAVQTKSAEIPIEITQLDESINKIKARLSAGITYGDLSSLVAPFLQALEKAKSSSATKEYDTYIANAQRISNMLSVLSETWNLYINSTSVSNYITTHEVSCKTAKNIRVIWNDAVGYKDIHKIKGGLLGCLSVDLGKFSSPYGNTNWPQYMLQSIQTNLSQIANFSNQSGGTVPVVSIPENAY